MKNMTLENMAEVCHGLLNIPESINREEALVIEASSICIDSRLVTTNGIFVATKGNRVDGHDFIEAVAEKGVLAVVCEKKPSVECIYILVEDSFIAIKQLAKFYRSQLTLPIVGIVGSMGKTSTKEMVAAVLSQKYRVHKTKGNFNNEVGVPLTLFDISMEDEIAVVEMGISDFGEMDRLGDMVNPDCVIMTNIGPCHLEFLHDLEGVLKAKSEVFNHMRDGKGQVILNGNDELLKGIKEINGKKTLHFGNDDSNDIYADNIVNKGLEGIDAVIHYENDSIKVSIPLPGLYMVNNALAGAAAGLHFGMNLEEIKKGIEAVSTLNGRCNLIRTDKYLVVDDCYNANPESMKNAIDLLAMTNTRKVAVLGDMFELGDNSKSLHEMIGRHAVNKEIDVILIAGHNSFAMFNEALRANSEDKSVRAENRIINYYESTELLEEALINDNILKAGDTVLLKASHGMNYSMIVKMLSE